MIHIALDPASWWFECNGPGQRVDKSDAVLVQVIHTCTSAVGIKEAIGTSDFYPNGGKEQPGCGSIRWIGKQKARPGDICRQFINVCKLTGLQFAGDVEAIGCAHSRAFLYYAESITNPKGFRADNVFMGGPILDAKYVKRTVIL